jgi:DNA repair protein RAD50
LTGADPPLSDRGRNFVYDPSIDGKSLVRARIDVVFHAPPSKMFQVTRTMEVKLNRTTRSFRALDGVFKVRDLHSDAEPVTTSHKCSDIDRLVPPYLGVSKAVLENVVFCHQEDSAWPLSESKVLQVKFDDIFASARYTRALDELKKVAKTKTADAKLLKEQLRTIEVSMKQAREFRNELKRANVEIDDATNAIQELDEQLAIFHKQTKTLEKHQKTINTFQTNIQECSSRISYLSDEVKKLQRSMKQEFTEPEEELLQQSHEMKRSIEAWKTRRSELQAQAPVIARRLQDKKKLFSRLQRRIADAKAAERAHQEKLSQAQHLVDELFHRLELRDRISMVQHSSPTEYTLQYLSSFADALSQVEQEEQQALNSMRTAARQEDQQYERQVSNIKSQISGLEHTIRTKRSAAKSALTEISNLEAFIVSIDRRLGELQDIQRDLKQAESAYQNFCDSTDRSDELEQQLKLCREDLKTNAATASRVATEMKQLERQRDVVTQLKMHRKELADLHTQCDTELVSLCDSVEVAALGDGADVNAALTYARTHGTGAHNHNGDDDDEEDRSRNAEFYAQAAAQLDSLITDAINTADSKLATSQQSVNDAVHTVSTAEAELKAARRALTKSQRKDNTEAKYFAQHEISPDEDLQVRIRAAGDTLEEATQNKQLQISADALYQRLLKSGLDSGVCPCCNRGMNVDEKHEFERVNRGKLAALAEAKAQGDVNERVESAQQSFDQLQKVAPRWGTWQQTREQRAAQEAQVAECQSAVTSSRATLQEIKDQHATLKARHLSVQQLKTQLRDLDSLVQRATTSCGKVRSESQHLSDMSNGGRTLDQTQAERSRLQREREQLDEQLSELHEQLATNRREKDRLQSAVEELRKQSLQVSELLADKKTKEAEITKLQSSIDSANRQAQDAQTQLAPLRQQLDQVQQDRAAAQQQNESQARLQANRCKSYSNENVRVRSDLTELRQYVAGASERASVAAQLKSESAEMKAVQAEDERVRSERENVMEKLNEATELWQDVQTNIEYRAACASIAQVELKRNELESELEAYQAKLNLNDDLNGIRREEAKLIAQRGQLAGRRGKCEEQMTELKRNLRGAAFKDIDSRYEGKVIEEYSTRTAVVDLQRLAKALNQALQDFHSVKMKQINDLLRDYWRDVYRGTDIDYIEIKSNPKESGTAKRRVYHYRVVMHRGGTELDMRGRCSAGQKVLASLLIRLALAETFSTKCSVLTLDEPTTNLDQRNIEAFAEALNQLISKRRAMGNLQLILITHDEQFVHLLGQRALSDTYYRVKKNTHGQSIIKQQRFDVE